MRNNTRVPSRRRNFARSALVSRGGRLLPGRENLVMYTRSVVDSIGVYDIVIDSGSDQSDWILTMPDSDIVRGILGINNDFYNASGVPVQMSWIELQTAADGNVYLFAGRKGTCLYNVDMSADEALIMRALGGLYVLSAAGYPYDYPINY